MIARVITMKTVHSRPLAKFIETSTSIGYFMNISLFTDGRFGTDSAKWMQISFFSSYLPAMIPRPVASSNRDGNHIPSPPDYHVPSCQVLLTCGGGGEECFHACLVYLCCYYLLIRQARLDGWFFFVPSHRGEAKTSPVDPRTTAQPLWWSVKYQ